MAIFSTAILLMVVGCATSSEDVETVPVETSDVVESSDDSSVSDAVVEVGDASEETVDVEEEGVDSSEEDASGDDASSNDSE